MPIIQCASLLRVTTGPNHRNYRAYRHGIDDAACGYLEGAKVGDSPLGYEGHRFTICVNTASASGLSFSFASALSMMRRTCLSLIPSI